MARPGSGVLGMCLCPWTSHLPLKTIRTPKQSPDQRTPAARSTVGRSQQPAPAGAGVDGQLCRALRARHSSPAAAGLWQGRVACGLRARSGAAACRCTGRLAPVWSWLRARAGVGIGDSRALAAGPAAGAAGEVGAGRPAARGRGGGAPAPSPGRRAGSRDRGARGAGGGRRPFQPGVVRPTRRTVAGQGSRCVVRGARGADCQLRSAPAAAACLPSLARAPCEPRDRCARAWGPARDRRRSLSRRSGRTAVGRAGWGRRCWRWSN